HDHGSVAVDGVVTGEQADVAGPVATDEVAVLLVGEGLQGGRVESLGAVLEGTGDRVFGHDRLARSGGRGDDDRVPGVHRVKSLQLERVWFEAQGGDEGLTRGQRRSVGRLWRGDYFPEIRPDSSPGGAVRGS